jgi:hypothetical protein
MVVVNLVYGLTLPLLSIVLDAQGVSKTVIGLSIVAQASAGVLLAPLMPRFITRSGRLVRDPFSAGCGGINAVVGQRGRN